MLYPEKDASTGQVSAPVSFTKRQPPFHSQSFDPELGRPRTYPFTESRAAVIPNFRSPNTKGFYKLHGVVFLSYNSHTDKYPVTGLGRRYVKSFTHGHEIFAGTIGFNVFTDSPFIEILRAYAEYLGIPEAKIPHIRPSQLPPFDMSIVFADDHGATNALVLYGVEILDQADNFTLDNIRLTQSYSFVCTKITTMSTKTEFSKEDYLGPESTSRNVSTPNPNGTVTTPTYTGTDTATSATVSVTVSSTDTSTEATTTTTESTATTSSETVTEDTSTYTGASDTGTTSTGTSDTGTTDTGTTDTGTTDTGETGTGGTTSLTFTLITGTDPP